MAQVAPSPLSIDPLSPEACRAAPVPRSFNCTMVRLLVNRFPPWKFPPCVFSLSSPIVRAMSGSFLSYQLFLGMQARPATKHVSQKGLLICVGPRCVSVETPMTPGDSPHLSSCPPFFSDLLDLVKRKEDCLHLTFSCPPLSSPIEDDFQCKLLRLRSMGLVLSVAVNTFV